VNDGRGWFDGFFRWIVLPAALVRVRTSPGTGAERRGPLTTLADARAKLEAACSDFDAAVRSISGGDPCRDTVMASPHLLAVIKRVVKARRQVDCLASPAPLASSKRAP
jgi:hypothetical protein